MINHTCFRSTLTHSCFGFSPIPPLSSSGSSQFCLQMYNLAAKMWSATPAIRSVLEEFPANFSNLNKGAKCHTYFHCQLRVWSVWSEQVCHRATKTELTALPCSDLRCTVALWAQCCTPCSGATYRSVEVHYWGCPDSEHKKVGSFPYFWSTWYIWWPFYGFLALVHVHGAWRVQGSQLKAPYIAHT